MKRKLLVITAGLVVFACVFVAWRRWVEFVPPDETPTVTMPSPNAYDFYVKAGQAHVSASSDLDPVYDSREIPEAQWKTHYPIAKKEEWLRKNSKSLRLLREGSKYPYRTPVRSQGSPNHFPFYASSRELARKLSLESRVYGEKGQWGQASNSALDCMHFGHDLSRGGILIDYLVGQAIKAIGRKELWEVLPHLSSEQSQVATQRLQTILSQHTPYSQVLQAEKDYTLRTYLSQMSSPGWSTMELTNITGLPRAKELWQIFVTPRRVIYRNYDDYMNAVIKEADQPYSTSRKWPSPPTDFFHRIILSSPDIYANVHLQYTKEQATDALLLTSLALRAFALDHQRNPQTLDELTPRYLKAVPIDPFGNGKPLRYQPKTTNALFYSVGPDGIDNNGVATEDKKLKGKRAFYTDKGSKGDFVAGVNY